MEDVRWLIFKAEVNWLNYFSLVIRLRRVPFTRYNICPRMKRACRKSWVVTLIVASAVAFVVMVLSIYASYLIAIRTDEYDKLADSVITSKNKLSSATCSSYTNTSSLKGPLCSYPVFVDRNLNYEAEKHTAMFAFLSFIFLLSTALMHNIRKCLCSTTFVSHSKGHKTKCGARATPLPVIVCTSVTTQTYTDI